MSTTLEQPTEILSEQMQRVDKLGETLKPEPLEQDLPLGAVYLQTAIDDETGGVHWFAFAHVRDDEGQIVHDMIDCGFSAEGMLQKLQAAYEQFVQTRDLVTAEAWATRLDEDDPETPLTPVAVLTACQTCLKQAVEYVEQVREEPPALDDKAFGENKGAVRVFANRARRLTAACEALAEGGAFRPDDERLDPDNELRKEIEAAKTTLGLLQEANDELDKQFVARRTKFFQDMDGLAAKGVLTDDMTDRLVSDTGTAFANDRLDDAMREFLQVAAEVVDLRSLFELEDGLLAGVDGKPFPAEPGEWPPILVQFAGDLLHIPLGLLPIKLPDGVSVDKFWEPPSGTGDDSSPTPPPVTRAASDGYVTLDDLVECYTVPLDLTVARKARENEREYPMKPNKPLPAFSSMWMDERERQSAGLPRFEVAIDALIDRFTSEQITWFHRRVGDTPETGRDVIENALLGNYNDLNLPRFVVLGGHGDESKTFGLKTRGNETFEGLVDQDFDKQIDLLIVVACSIGQLRDDRGLDLAGLATKLLTCRSIVAAKNPVFDSESTGFLGVFLEKYMAACNEAALRPDAGDEDQNTVFAQPASGVLPMFQRARLFRDTRRELTTKLASKEHNIVPDRFTLSLYHAYSFDLYGAG